jgi:hypothetical protein
MFDGDGSREMIDEGASDAKDGRFDFPDDSQDDLRDMIDAFLGAPRDCKQVKGPSTTQYPSVIP